MTDIPTTDRHGMAAETYKFEFTGSAGEMVPIIIKNFLLNLITLSFYRFWGRTNVRRYLWQNTRFMGDPLEYTGTGMELFKGFLLVLFLVLLPLFGMFFAGEMLMLQGRSIGILLMVIPYGLFIFLMPYGFYLALRYRMSRTVWRGIRGAQVGSPAGFAWASIGYGLMVAFSFGLALPYVENQLWRFESNNRRFGTGAFSFEAGSGPLYKAYLLGLAVAVAGFITMMILMGGAVVAAERSGDQAAFMGMFMAVYLLFIIVAALAFSYYSYAKLRHFAQNTHFDGAVCQFAGTYGGFLKLLIGNILVVVLTLGIGFPIAQMRVVRYVMGNLSLEGRIDFGRIGQSQEAAPAYGEGLAEAFDMGTI